MKRTIEKNNIIFELANYTPRRNEYERGQKYKLFVDGIPTRPTFRTLKEGRDYINKNYFIYL